MTAESEDLTRIVQSIFLAGKRYAEGDEPRGYHQVIQDGVDAILSRLSPAPAEGMGDKLIARLEGARHAMRQMQSASREAAAQSIGWGPGHVAATYGDVADAISAAIDWIAQPSMEAPAPAPSTGGREEPIKMILFCPACGLQHIDEPEEPLSQHGGFLPPEPGDDHWTNPPHRSHLCHGCGHIWRPADVPTEGVAAIETKGKADSPPASPSPLSGEVVGALREAEKTLRKATTWFHDYAEGHAAKGAKDKAERNAGRGLECLMAADRATAALASLQGEAQ